MAAQAGASGFDVKTLEQLGYNADIADFFDTTRFLPGVHRVTLEVNAAQRYQEEVRFDQEGALCLDAHLAETLRLRITTPLSGCERIESRWPQAQVRVFPGDFRVELTLPEEAFDADKMRSEQRGGYAVMMNYDLFGNRIQSRYGKQQTLQAMLEPGVNISNWVVRNRSSYSNSETGSQLAVYETSASRDFPAWNAFVQAGEFGAGGALSGGLPITGVQLSSLDAGYRGAALTVPLQGSVTSQSVVEVKQRGQVVYRTLLPSGPFALGYLGQAMAGVEAEVIITESDGRQQQYTVTPGAGDEQARQGGYQFALGRYRNYGGRQDASAPPALLMGERTISLGAGRQLGAGGVLSTAYQRLAGQGSLGDDNGNWLSAGWGYSRGRQRGMQFDAQGQSALTGNLSLSLTAQYRTAGFRDADEALGGGAAEDGAPRLRYSSGMALSWRTPAWGSLTYSLSHERQHNDSRRSWTHSLAYGKSVGRAMLSLNLQSSAYDRAALYAGLSVPLGGGSISSRLQTNKNSGITVGSGWQGALGERLDGGLDVARDSAGEYRVGGNLYGDTPYTRLSAGASRSGNGSTSLSVLSSGVLGVANGTWVTSSQRIGDTLAVVKVPGQSGVNVSGGGRGMTDFAGHALLSSVTPYTPLSARIDTLSLPLNVRLDSTEVPLELARGTVAMRQLRVTEVKQLLLSIRDEQGAPLATGASVHDEKGQLLGTLMGEGNLMLVNEDIGKTLQVRRANRNACRVSYEVPEAFNPAALYEERDAVCR